MLNDFFSHCYVAPVQFDRVGDALIITNDAPDSRGSWIAWWSDAVKPGQMFQLLGVHTGGQIKALFFQSQSEYMNSVDIEPGDIFEIIEGATMLRIDLRLWDVQGTANFQNIRIVEYVEPEPDPEPDDPPVTLPLPTPNILEDRYWVGYKWGRNVFIMDTSEEGFSIPADRGDAYEVQGVQRGRNINLEIGNIITAQIDEEDSNATD
jgi:hypothetical protein